MRKVLVFLLIGLFACQSKETKIGVVNEEEVFKSFDMAKEAMSRLEKKKAQVVDELDSLESVLMLVKMNPEQQYQIKQHIIQRQERLSIELNSIKEKEYSLVWNRINIHSKEYAKEKGFTVLIGKKTDGIWYNADNVDVTKDLIAFINSKYNNQ